MPLASSAKLGQLNAAKETIQEAALQDPIRTAILPCEIKSREFDSKLLLACILAERGWRIIVGSRNHIHLKLARLTRSVYLGKDVRYSSQIIVQILNKLGHQFIAQDEEAQFYFSRERYRKARVHPEVLQAAKHL